jgi:DNA-binding NarL/FixJ family response regulator
VRGYPQQEDARQRDGIAIPPPLVHGPGLLAGSPKKVGYLLKDRVADVRDFIDAVERVASGGTALDPEVISQIFSRSRRRETLDALTPRERDVLAAMAEGSSNAAIAAKLVVSEGDVEKHVSNIFA